MGAKVGIQDKPYFRGQSIHRLDAKGRLRIPSKFRETLQNHYTDCLIITVMEECLVAYPPEIWEGVEVKVADLSQFDPQNRDFMRYHISSAEVCEFDNQGRVLIPQMLRDQVGLGQEVVLAGMLKSFEIWDRQTWDKKMSWTKEHYRQIAHNIGGMGL